MSHADLGLMDESDNSKGISKSSKAKNKKSLQGGSKDKE